MSPLTITIKAMTTQAGSSSLKFTQEDQTMSDTTEQFEGGCLCGAIRFVATGQPKAIYWCHCQSCRSHTGAPVSVFALFDGKDYTVTKGCRQYRRGDKKGWLF